MAKVLSHEETWDDDYLQNSWNNALEEYKRYHSLHARGENVEKVIQQALEAEHGSDEIAVEAGVQVVDSQRVQAAAEEIELVDNNPAENVEMRDADNQNHARSNPHQQTQFHSIPPPVLEKVQDESVKNLIMSWYYAGYYTGFYEGQQSVQQPSNT